MPRFVAFLRAVNLGGNTTLRMEALRETLGTARFGPVETILQSGNVLLSSDALDAPALETRLERLLDRSFGLRTDVLARTADEWHEVVRRNPFPEAARDDPSHLTVLILKSPARTGAWEDLARGIQGREVVKAAGRWGYLVYPDGIGQSRLTLERIERALGTRGTLRNWNTTLKIEQRLAAT